MSIEIPAKTVRDIVNGEQIFILIDKEGREQVVVAVDGPTPNPDAYIMITLNAAKQMVTQMEAVMNTSLADVDAGMLGDQIYQPAPVILH